MGKWKGVRLNVKKDPNHPIELYDLSKDVGEKDNVAFKHPEIVRKLETAMRDSHRTNPIFPFIK